MLENRPIFIPKGGAAVVEQPDGSFKVFRDRQNPSAVIKVLIDDDPRPPTRADEIMERRRSWAR